MATANYILNMIYYITEVTTGKWATSQNRQVDLVECAAVYPAKGDTTDYFSAATEEEAVEHFGLTPYTNQEPKPEEPTPTLEEVSKPYLQALDNRLEEVARSLGYDSVLSCISYVGSANSTRAAQAVAMRDWRDACYDFAASMQAKYADAVATGGELPTISEFIDTLPSLHEELL